MRRLIALFTALALGAASCAGHPARAVCIPTPSAGSSGSASGDATTVLPRSTLPPFSRVVVVVMENKDYSEIIGNPEAYLNSLTRKYGLATNLFAITHPSLPNYLALTAGSTFGITSDCAAGPRGVASAPNLVDELEAAGISWKAYMEDIPSPCYKARSAGDYAQKHNPFLYYRDIATDPARHQDRPPRRVDLGSHPRFLAQVRVD